MKPLKLHWSSGLKDGRKNLGDWLSPLLCERLSGRRVVHASPRRCDLVAVGSVLHRIKNSRFGRRIHVWGTGLRTEAPRFTSRHYYHALRGRKTDACIRHGSSPVFGDPALLCDMLPADLPRAKTHAVGVVPHYKDRDNPLVRQFLSANPQAVSVDVFSEPLDFIRQVAACEVVLSSSLHGLIVADSLSVPNAHIRLSDLVLGGDFKFQDYYSAFGMADSVFPLTAETALADVLDLAPTYRRPGIDQIKADLLAAFPFKP